MGRSVEKKKEITHSVTLKPFLLFICSSMKKEGKLLEEEWK